MLVFKGTKNTQGSRRGRRTLRYYGEVLVGLFAFFAVNYPTFVTFASSR
jgi:hypothetical protein